VTSVRSAPSGHEFLDLALCSGGYAALAGSGSTARIECFTVGNALASVIEHTLPADPTSGVNL
jgi:hypothetical protein